MGSASLCGRRNVRYRGALDALAWRGVVGGRACTRCVCPLTFQVDGQKRLRRSRSRATDVAEPFRNDLLDVLRRRRLALVLHIGGSGGCALHDAQEAL